MSKLLINNDKLINKFVKVYGLKKKLNVSACPIYLFIFQRFECTTLSIKELLLNLFTFRFY